MNQNRTENSRLPATEFTVSRLRGQYALERIFAIFRRFRPEVLALYRSRDPGTREDYLYACLKTDSSQRLFRKLRSNGFEVEELPRSAI